jgi:hypothetical protein
VDVEWVMLADGAQVVGGKLFVLGGAWQTVVALGGFPHQQHLAIAASIRVPSEEMAVERILEVEIAAEEPPEQLLRMSAKLAVPPSLGLLAGPSPKTLVAADLDVAFPHPGAYRIVLRIEGLEQYCLPFRVVAGPSLPTQ